MSLDLNLRIVPAESPSTAPPVLLIHGFASSSELNWERSGWLRHLNAAGRDVALIDLPGHGVRKDAAGDTWTPSLIREALDAALSSLESQVDVLGYSLGARLAWEFAAQHPQRVRRLVLGGAASHDPLASFALDQAREAISAGTQITDEYTAKVMAIAAAEPSNDLQALFKLIEGIKTERFNPAAAVPRCPVLLVAGDRDDLATTMPTLKRLLSTAGTATRIHWLPGRTHANAVTSRDFKNAAVEFFEEHEEAAGS